MRATVIESVTDLLARLWPSPGEGELAEPPLRTDGGAPPTADGDEDRDHLREVPDGAGCTEIWEHLSERSAEGAEADD